MKEYQTKLNYSSKLIRIIPPAKSYANIKASIRKEDFIVFSKALEAELQHYLSNVKNISVVGLKNVVIKALDMSSAKQSIRTSVLNRIAEKSNSSKLLLSYLYDYLLCNKGEKVIKI